MAACAAFWGCSSAALMVQAAEQDMIAALTGLDSLGTTRHDGSMEPLCSPEPEVCQAAASPLFFAAGARAHLATLRSLSALGPLFVMVLRQCSRDHLHKHDLSAAASTYCI